MYYKKLRINGVEYNMETHIVGEEDPTSETEGNLSQFYYNSNTGIFWKCTYSEDGVYSWEEFSTTAFDEVVMDEETRMLHFYKNGEDVVDPVYIAGGGSGGGGGSGNNAILTVTNMTGWLAHTISTGADCYISIDWSSLENEMETGAGILTIRVNNVLKRTLDISQGIVRVNIKDILATGSNKVKVSVTDVYENTKSINFTIKSVDLKLTSSFSTVSEFTAGEAVVFTYTPYGSVEKITHFEVDGTEVGTQTVTASGRQQSFPIPGMAHGAHSLKVWFTAEIDGEEVPSNILYFDMVVVGDSDAPIIASAFRTSEAVQYETLFIPYRVYTPGSLTSVVGLYAGNKKITELTVDRTEQTWNYRCDSYGELTLSIRSGTAILNLTVDVEQSDIDVEPEEDSLALRLTSAGRSNNEAHPEIWADTEHNISCTLSGFNFVSNGWVADKDGNTVLRVSGDARVTIPYKPFERDFRSTGKTLEFEFATRDVLDYDAILVSCMSGNRGFQLTSQRATLKSERSEISTQYKEDEHVRIAFVAEKRTESRLLYIYINGIMSGVVEYPDDDDFSQQTPVNISVGANTCTTDLYNIRIYDNNLTRFQIVGNWIADTQNITAMLARHAHNDVFDEYGRVVISKLPNDLPFMIIEAEELPQYKGDKQTVSVEYTDPVTPARSFTATGCQANVQGTSSAPYARKNYDMQFKGGFVMPGGAAADNYELAPGIVPFNRFVLKADVASSESANNVELVKLFCETDPYKRPEEIANSKVRKGIYGFPIVLFWRNPADGSEQFMGKYNFNLPKRAPGPYGYSGDMESWEFQNNTSNLMLFLSDYFSEAPQADPDTGDVKAAWRYDYEARFPEDTWVDISKLQEFQSFVFSTYRAGATGNDLSAPVTYPETHTVYDEVVDPETGAVDYVERLVTEDVTYTKDTADYRLSRFHHEFGKYAEVDSFIFYYIFTELFLMVDSRAKNLFIGFSGGPTTGLAHLDRKAVAEPYDMDTAIGTNNEGSLVFDYGLEDTDHLEGGADVFNGQNSVLWCNLRDAFGSEIAQMYKNLRSAGILSYATVSARFTDHQAKWPEAIFNEDAQFKYLDPLVNPDPGKAPTAVYLPMLQGSKAEQRKWWLYNRFRYMDSKWNAGDALSDVIQLRGYAKADITVTPYADIYPTIKYGSVPVQARGKHGVPQTLACPLDNVNDTEIYIYSASQLASVGDLSGLKVGFADFSKATKLQSIKVGSDAAGYTNQNLTGLSVGTNPLLGSVDARNCTSLVGTVDLSGATNIEHVYLEGTAVTGVALPNGGVLKTLHLPGTVTNLTVRNQPGITSFVMPDYENITTLRVENCPGIPVEDILAEIPANSRVRILGFSATMTTVEEVEDFYDYLDTMRGLDESGGNLDKPVVSGVITGLDAITGAWLAEMTARYPNIEIEYQHISSQLKYYNYDGTELLNTETILDGGNGTYDGTPARTSTAQYSYTFVGWNKNKNATAADTNATKAVTADRNVYAAYTATVRTYTVTWKNSNGTVLETDTGVAYGSTPKYNGSTPQNPDTSGGTFRGWTPTVTTVTGNATYTATYTPKYNVYFYNGSTLLQTVSVLEGGTAVYTGETPVNSEDSDAEFLGWAASKGQSVADPNILKNITANKTVYAAFASSWDAVFEAIDDGTYATKYHIGDTVPLTLSDGQILHMEVVGIDADDLAYVDGKAPLTFMAVEVLNEVVKINTSQNTTSGWGKTNLRLYLNTTVFQKIPEVITNRIIQVKKYTQYWGQSNNQLTYEKLWIPSAYEMGFTGHENIGVQYTEAFPNAVSKIKYSGTSKSLYPLRSPNNSSYYTCVSEYGDIQKTLANGSHRTTLGFCVGKEVVDAEITDDWSAILSSIDNGTYKEKYPIGSYKPLDLGTEGTINMQIVAMNEDDMADGSGKAPITMISKELLNTSKNMKNTSSTSGGWAASVMRTYLKNTILPLIPAEVAGSIKSVTKYSSHYTNGAVQKDVTSTDDLWIPSDHEIFGSTTHETLGPVYNIAFPNKASRVKYKVGASSAGTWWLRSAYNASKYEFVTTGGIFGDYNADLTNGIALGFCLGEKYSWSEVFKSIDDGTYAEKYKIGDTVELKLSTNETVDMAIVGIDADDMSGRSGKAPLTFIASKALSTTQAMNDSGKNTGGWAATVVRTYLNETIFPTIPSEVADRIVPVLKHTKYYNVTGDQLTSDKLWIPSVYEMCGTGSGIETSGVQYTEAFPDNESRSGRGSSCWLRTADTSQTGFRELSSTGTFSSRITTYKQGVLLGFSIGSDPVISDSWDEILTSVADGTAASKYSVGDYKELDLGSEGKVNMKIAAFDADDLADGSGKAKITWIADELLATSKAMNPALVTNYVYPDSPSWTNSNNSWTTQNKYTVSTAKATWTITATTAGTLTVYYKTSDAAVENNALDVTVNGESVVSGWAGISSSTYTVECAESDTVTVIGEYKLLEAGNYTANIIFASTGSFSVEALVENAPKRTVESYDDSTGTIGGWKNSAMRAYLTDTIQPLIEASQPDLMSAIKSVKKYSRSYDTAGTKNANMETADKLWIPSAREAGETAYETSGPAYSVLFDSDGARVKTRNGTAYSWALRSAYSTEYWEAVMSKGNIGIGTGTNGVVLGFCT